MDENNTVVTVGKGFLLDRQRRERIAENRAQLPGSNTVRDGSMGSPVTALRPHVPIVQKSEDVGPGDPVTARANIEASTFTLEKIAAVLRKECGPDYQPAADVQSIAELIRKCLKKL